MNSCPFTKSSVIGKFHCIYIYIYIYIRTLKSRRLQWAEHVARGGEWKKNTQASSSKTGWEVPTWQDKITWDLKEVDYEDD